MTLNVTSLTIFNFLDNFKTKLQQQATHYHLYILLPTKVLLNIFQKKKTEFKNHFPNRFYS